MQVYYSIISLLSQYIRCVITIYTILDITAMHRFCQVDTYQKQLKSLVYGYPAYHKENTDIASKD